ncbi:MAG: tRNA (adenosine(37)-N6)-threonylcarbamoyltransferase complex transferase subunit TsaD [Patescibacteria group bacterium]|jgi:N6-L-threonylcarbamoyladenine synthase
MNKNKPLLILGIESSCDETAASVVEFKGGRIVVKSNVVLSQVAIHRKFGGVVPEVAARKHLENILPVIDLALKQAKVKMAKIDKIAVTAGPGLITSLRVGVETARTLSYVYNKPMVGVNHLVGHLLSGQISNSKNQIVNSKFPVLGLIVSGGHTELVLVKKIGKYQKVGQTLDDAAGECFDKVAKILGLGYPGGPAIAVKARNGRLGRFNLPSPMIKSADLNFSFSGLKTAVLYFVQKQGKPKGQALNDFCATVQNAVVEVLVIKTLRAAKQFKVKEVWLGGGVAANGELRKRLQEGLVKASLISRTGGSKLRITNYARSSRSASGSAHGSADERKLRMAEIKYCGDNAVMVALAGYYQKPKKDGWREITVDPNEEIKKNKKK